jgi:hypothetical protein
MNPLHYAGTQPLDQAAADRYALVLNAPEYRDLTSDQQEFIGKSTIGANFFPIQDWNPAAYQKLKDGEGFSNSLKEAQEAFNTLKDKIIGVGEEPGLLAQVYDLYKDSTSTYFSQLVKLMKKNIEDTKDSMSANEYNSKLESLYSGRRVAMTTRTFLSCLAVKWGMKGSRPSPQEIDDIMIKVIEQSDITVLYGPSLLNKAAFSTAHATAIKTIKFSGDYWEYRAEVEENPIKKAFIYLATKSLDNNDLAISEWLKNTITIKDSEKAEKNVDKRYSLYGFISQNEDFFTKEWAKSFIIPASLTMTLGSLVMLPSISTHVKSAIQESYELMLGILYGQKQSNMIASVNDKYSEYVQGIIAEHSEKFKDSIDPLDWLPLELFQTLCTAITHKNTHTRNTAIMDYEQYMEKLQATYTEALAIVADVKKYIYPGVNRILSKNVTDVTANATVIKDLLAELASESF